MTSDAAVKRQAEDDVRALRVQLAVFGLLGLSGLVLSYLHIVEAVQSVGVLDWTSYALAAAPDAFVVALAYRALWLSSRDRRHGAEVTGTLGFLGATLAANLYVAPRLDVPTLVIYGAPAVVAAAGFLFAEMALRDTRGAREAVAALADVEAAPRKRRPTRQAAPERPTAAPEPSPAPEPAPESSAPEDGAEGPSWPHGDEGKRAAWQWLDEETAREGREPTNKALQLRTGMSSSWSRATLAAWRKARAEVA